MVSHAPPRRLPLPLRWCLLAPRTCPVALPAAAVACALACALAGALAPRSGLPLLVGLGALAALVALAARVHARTARRLVRSLRAARAHAAAARTEARAAGRARAELLALLGHELRNPLSPIVTALALLRRRGQAASREHAVIARQVDHLVQLVDDLLDVARITRGTLELRRERLELAAAVARALDRARPLLEARRHRLELDVPAGLAVDADPARLAQAIASLLDNAARYTPPGGRVTVRGGRTGAGEVALAVEDDGQGIPPELLPRVFEPFVQGARTPDRREGGLGLGLALARSLVALHGGRLAAHSAGPGLGARFELALPAAATPPALAERPALRPTVRSLRVLVVDDNEDAAALLADLLDQAGHEVITALDGAAALDAAERFRPEVAVLDLGLPVMDGYELAARIGLRLGPTAPALLSLSGYGQPQDRARSRAAGFRQHFVKPADPDALLAAIEALGAAARPEATLAGS